MASDQPSQAAFAFHERQRAQILAVVPEQIEGVEDRLAASFPHQLYKLAAAISAKANQLAIENRVRDRQVCQGCRECTEGFVDDLLAADQSAGTVFNVGQRPKAVMLQLENPIQMIERLRDS